jgi:hypothetical protein
MITQFEKFELKNLFKKNYKKLSKGYEFVPIIDELGEYIARNWNGPRVINVNRDVIEEYSRLSYEYVKENLLGKIIRFVPEKKNFKVNNMVNVEGIMGGYIDMPFPKEGCLYIKLIDIHKIRNYNLIYHFVSDEYLKYLISWQTINNTWIAKRVNRIITKEDPYGEEDWETDQ